MHTTFIPVLCLIICSTLPIDTRPSQKTEHPVGFKSYWVTDSARTYRTVFDDGKTYGATKSPRPVLVNVWYPAREGGSPMEHGNYLDISSDDPRLKPLAKALVEYNRKVIAQEFVGVDEDKANERQKQELSNALKRSTRCVRNAATAQGRYPLVIYHSGAGSSFEDNAMLCEELARSGFVVIGSAFQEAEGKSFNVDPINAGRDFEFLIRLAAQMDNVDVNHIGLVGHSAGAHASLIYAAKPGIAVDAVVSLDTTQDYVTLADVRWYHLVGALTDGRDQYKTPTMFVAGPGALFELADTLVNSERLYLTLPVLTHNEYILQRETTAAIKAELASDSKAELAERAKAVANYSKELRRLVQLYLTAKLKMDQSAFEELKKLQATKLGNGARTELMPVGAIETNTIKELSPRSVFTILKKNGSEAAIRELRSADEKNTLMREVYFALQLQYYLANTGKPEQAKQLFEYYLSVGSDVRPLLVSLADHYSKSTRLKTFVDRCVRLGQVIGGDNQAVVEMVKKHGKGIETPK